MTRSSRRALPALGLSATIIAAGWLAVLPQPASAQDFPEQPIQIIVPYTAGSNMDTYARGAAPLLSKYLDVPVVVENVPGATGWNRIYSASPDGYTLGVGDQTGQIGIGMLQPLPFEIDRFTWLGHFSTGNQMIVLSGQSQFKSMDDLRNAQTPVRCGTFGGLSAGAMQCAMLASELGFELAFVNVAGPSEVPLAAVRGDIDIGSVGVNLWLDHIQAGTVTPVVVWAEERDERVPDVPALADIGMAGSGGITVFRAMFAPPELPTERRDLLLEALNQVIEDPDWQAFLEKGNLDTNATFDASYQQAVEDATGEVEAIQPLLQSAF